MVAKLLVHVRRHSIAYVALFFALGGTSWAVGNGPPFVSGGGEILSGTARTPPFDSSKTTGPNVLTVPGFGDVFISECEVMFPDGSLGLSVDFRNTSGVAIDGSAPLLWDPISNRGGTRTQQLVKGPANARTVATVTFSGVADTAGNECRAAAQATIQEVSASR